MKELNLEDILKNTTNLKEKKVWIVSIIWRPNVWKSSFINSLIWEKVSIVSSVPQTTRKKILSIYNDEDSQIIFLDTPWIHKSNYEFNKEINKESINSLKDSDLVLYFIDSTRELWEEENYIKDIISNTSLPVIKVYTKWDLSPKIKLKKDAIIISSVSKDWFDKLIFDIKSYLKTEKQLYPEDFYTKQDLNFRISEIIREKLFMNTKQELPHDSFVSVEEIRDEKNLIKISAYIYLNSESQKYIVIWKSGFLIWKIWKEARLDLEKIFSKKVFLSLRVKVKKWWKKDSNFIKNMFK